MELKTFFDNFELLADAPNGVQKLREMILQLAVQGKLVPQDKRDEPVSVLLENIKAESLPPNKPIPYKLPENWEWVRLEELIDLISGQHIKSSDYNSERIGVGYLTGPSDFGNIYPIIKKWTENPKVVAYKNDILLTVKGAGLGKNNIVDIDKVAISRQLMAIRCKRAEFRYVHLFLKSKYSYFQNAGTGIAIPGINREDVLSLSCPLPPLNEQKRIVAKVDELMALCDELEARKLKAATNCIRLNDASLDGLVTATEAKNFNKSWQRICDSFDILYSRPENVVKLRQTILQLAVQGKLVPQDPKDEPASVLLEKVKAEKERMVKEGKIRKAEPLPAIDLSELPFELPKGWEWVRLGLIGFTQTGTTPSKSNPAYFGDYIPFIKPGDIFENGISYNNEGLSKKGSENGRLIDNHSVLMVCIGGSIGKVNFIDRHCSCNQQINTITPYCDIPHKLLNYFMRSTYFQAQVIKRASKTTLPIISKGKWELIPVPLPSLNEQRRIVAKIDELMGFCEELEAGLSQSQTDCNSVMKVAVTEIMAA